ncbi:peroxidase-related enzyme [Curtobacterium sp. USHLN213]|uniref:peroxidase-related enzyme n=1 Tax=Curtobacterium sp. USHLN213 TaxID=3081255 RepID=UPI003019DAC3
MPAPTFHGEPLRRAPLTWDPYIAVPAELDDAQRAALAPAQRRSGYYQLLSMDPPTLAARTAVDSAIFYSRQGLPRGERELCAAVSSFVTGCPVCTATHVGFAGKFTKRAEDVDRLLEDGLDVDIDYRWNSIINVAGQLAQPVPALGRIDIDVLRGMGMPEDEILDVVHSTSFFAWANRLLLTLGLSRYTDGD